MKQQRQLGRSGPMVGAVGYGAMVLEGIYGAIDEGSALAVLRHGLPERGGRVDGRAEAGVPGRVAT